MIADELRRQADLFVDLKQLEAKVGRNPVTPQRIDGSMSLSSVIGLAP